MVELRTRGQAAEYRELSEGASDGSDSEEENLVVKRTQPARGAAAKAQVIESAHWPTTSFCLSSLSRHRMRP